ncbi:hypothetical protein FRX31_010780 [Thalictrum thalictroides]|uniref:Uncharacterized protein n=1 Tax=Thalictrum thalictroides TaxID=46969 RepID=A0A7J6WRN1_THATH|nr:hypothetical protein FRX31_010780 [Thalictrum thalictroides]
MMKKRKKSVQKTKKGKVKVKASELRKSPRKVKKVTFVEPIVEPGTQGGGLAVRWSIIRLEKSQAQQNEEEGCENNVDNDITFLGEDNTQDILVEDDLVLPIPTNNSEPEYVPEVNVKEEVEAETKQCEKRNKGNRKPWQKDDTSPPPVDINSLPEEDLNLDTTYYDGGEDMVDEINADEDYR